MSKLPKPVLPGDTIGIIAPAGQLKEREAFNEGIKLLTELGYKLKFPRDLWPGNSYLADSDINRAKEFHKLWADPEVDAVMCLRGGYGSLRILPYLELSEIKKQQKYLIGFSDITILQNYLFDTVELISIQGPVVTSIKEAPRETLQLFQEILSGKTENIFKQKDIELIHGSTSATGKLIGGNLTSLVTLLGTPYDIQYDGRILFLEDVLEPTYKVDRMLTQLFLAGKFNNLAGILVGDFSSEINETSSDKLRHIEAVWERIIELTSNKSIPILGNISSGHIAANNPIVIGSELFIESGTNKIETVMQ